MRLKEYQQFAILDMGKVAADAKLQCNYFKIPGLCQVLMDTS